MAGHKLLADRVQRWVRYLSEELSEVIEQHPGLVRQHRGRGVGAHRPDGFFSLANHGIDEHVKLLDGVTIGVLFGL